jgi:hypothetical protein
VRWGGLLLLLLGACGASVDGDTFTPDTAPPVDSPLAVVDAGVDTPPDSRPCTGGDAQMTAADGSCVVFFTTPQNFANADDACIAFGSRLAILNTAERDAAAKALIGTADVWLGLTDQAVEGVFVWVDGTPLVFENFADTEPNNANGSFEEDCTMYSGVRGGWDDRPCSNAVPNIGATPTEYPFLCMF